ncbi:MAG: hypothetical protein RL226_1182 [Bacteroidota bacterium]
MKKIEVNYTFYEFEDASEIDQEKSALMEAAVQALQNAYAPYSNFRVGAAVLLGNGQVITGNNQENAAYPSGLCAERVALFAAKASFPKEQIKLVAIATELGLQTGDTIAPCGACRQVFAEYADQQEQPIELLLVGNSSRTAYFEDVRNLLPHRFRAEHLKKHR